MSILVDKIIADEEFGHLYVRTNSRAVRYTYRPANDGTPQCGVLITVPVRYDVADVKRSVEKMRPQLRQLLQKNQASKTDPDKTPASHHIDWDFKIESESLHIYIIKGIGQCVTIKHEPYECDGDDRVVKPGVIQLVCPPDFDFDAPGRQQWLEKVLIEGIRKHARVQLTMALIGYAAQYGIRVNDVKINSSKSHWGSCGHHTKRQGLVSKEEYYNINLSLFTVLLPLALQKLILLHELTHTRHMDHSPAFHRDLDAWLGGTEQQLEKQLKQYSTNIYAFI